MFVCLHKEQVLIINILLYNLFRRYTTIFKPKAKGIKSAQNVFLHFFVFQNRINFNCLMKGIKATTVLSVALMKIICTLQ